MFIDVSVQKELCTASGTFPLTAKVTIGKRDDDLGEIVGFYGPSGVGKTTLLRILAGLSVPDTGFIVVGGRVWLDTAKGINLPPQQRRVGFVFQNYALFPNMTVRENLRFAQHHSDKKHIEELLDVFGLTRLQNRRPDFLSGGQKQRVALARALARRPELLLLDEPLSALDHEMRSALQDEILKIHKLWGLTTILVSHDLPEVFKLCSRVITFKDGKVTDDGNPYAIFTRNRTSGKLQFVAEVLRVDREDVLDILTLFIGNAPVKVAVSIDQKKRYHPGEKVMVIAKAFNPIIEKLETS